MYVCVHSMPTMTAIRLDQAFPTPAPNRLNQGKAGSTAETSGIPRKAAKAAIPAANRLVQMIPIFSMPPTPALRMPPKNT